MYKIIIADDESWVRKSLKQQIDWELLNVSLVGEASNGIEAYNIAIEKNPDIILLDMKMPHMDGAKLMNIMKNEFPNLKIIAISAYSEFELMQNAVINKATNYILKPIDEKKLNSSISMAIDEIKKERREQENKKALKSKLDRSIPIVKEKLINKLITHKDISSSDLKRYLSDLNVFFKHSHYQIAVLHIINFFDILKTKFNNNLYDIDCTINNIINEIHSNNIVFLLSKSSIREKEYIILINREKIASYDIIVYELLENIIGNLKNFYRFEMNIGLGRAYKDINQTLDSYNEASYAINKNDSGNKDEIVLFENNEKKIKSFIVEEISIYLHSHYNEQITLEYVSELFYINSSYLCRIFKERMKINFIDYLANIRIQKAIELMQNDKLKTYQIAEMVGYNNSNYFSKLFKKKVGLSPINYRKQFLKHCNQLSEAETMEIETCNQSP